MSFWWTVWKLDWPILYCTTRILTSISKLDMAMPDFECHILMLFREPLHDTSIKVTLNTDLHNDNNNSNWLLVLAGSFLSTSNSFIIVFKQNFGTLQAQIFVVLLNFFQGNHVTNRTNNQTAILLKWNNYLTKLTCQYTPILSSSTTCRTYDSNCFSKTKGKTNVDDDSISHFHKKNTLKNSMHLSTFSHVVWSTKSNFLPILCKTKPKFFANLWLKTWKPYCYIKFTNNCFSKSIPSA